MTKIVVTQDLTLSEEHIARLRRLGEVKIYTDVPATDDEWLRRVAGYDVICTGQFGLRTKYQELRGGLISVPFVGIGFMDAEVLEANGVTLRNAPGSNKAAVTEWVVGMTINLLRKLPAYINVEGDHYVGLPERDASLLDLNVTVLGKGNIGAEVERVLIALGAKVRIFGRGDDLSECCKEAGVVISALSVNDSTTGLLDKAFFDGLKPGSYFVSITGAEIFDASALMAALDAGRLAGAAVDTGSTQVGNAADPYYLSLARHSKVLATPHVAYNTVASGRVGNDMMIDHIEEWLKETAR